MNAEARRGLPMLALIALFAAVLALIAVFYDDLVPQPQPAEVAISEVLRQAAEELDDITVSCRLDPNARLLSGTQTLTMVNRTGQTQSAAVFRSWSGAFLQEETSPVVSGNLLPEGTPFQSGGLQMLSASVNGSPTAFSWLDDACTVLAVDVPDAWNPGETLEAQLVWEVAIPEQKARFGFADGVFSLGNVFPIPAHWENGAWRTDPYTAEGDPFVSDCFNWLVDFTAPSAYSLAASGYSAPITSGGMKTWHLTAFAARDFAAALSDQWHQVAKWQNDTLIIAYAADREHAATMAKKAANALKLFSSLWGDYPWPTFTLCETALPWAGMEYPCMVMISDGVTKKSDVETTVVHETAHQWWYAVVGSDSVNEPWQDESLCEYALSLYELNHHGADKRAKLIASRTTLFTEDSEYTAAAYDFRPWLTLEKQVGLETLNAALKAYAESCRFTLADRQTLMDCLAQQTKLDAEELAQLFR